MEGWRWAEPAICSNSVSNRCGRANTDVEQKRRPSIGNLDFGSSRGGLPNAILTADRLEHSSAGSVRSQLLIESGTHGGFRFNLVLGILEPYIMR